MCRYVNINYLGLHKILKKHDKNMPDMRVHAFYASWIHREKWLSGDYSEELVMLSNVFSQIRGDTTGVKNEDSAQVRPPRHLRCQLTCSCISFCGFSSTQCLQNPYFSFAEV